jgi:hypothetical protein
MASDSRRSHIAAPARRTLNLGCGRKYLPEAVNVDINPRANPDISHDLNSLPWPLPDHCFDEICAYDIIEHLQDVMATMREIYRVARDEAIVRITVPHFSCSNSYSDPSHVRSFGYFSFDHFTGMFQNATYAGGVFKVCSRRLIFYPTLANKFVWRIANRYPANYERRWAWLFPAWFISLKLQVVKQQGAPGE